jgi:iron complex transport system permease protein
MKALATEPQLKRRLPMSVMLVCMAAFLVLAIIVSAGTGAVHLPLSAVVHALAHPSDAGEVGTVLFMLRLPRILAAGLVGAALSVTGVLFQGLFRNPLADPFVLGASGGAALGGAVGVFLLPGFLLAGFSATAALAFCGSLLTMILVWHLARIGGNTAMENLLLAGFALGTMLNAATIVFELREEVSNTGLRVLAAWLHGAISVPAWNQLGLVFAVETAAIIVALPVTRRLNTLALGEEYAEQLGVQVDVVRMLTVALGALLTALAVSLSGLIGFVGLLVPHSLRNIVGPDHTRLLPASALSGAIFLIIADTTARTVMPPTEIPVGVLTAFLGGPAFLYVLIGRRRNSL